MANILHFPDRFFVESHRAPHLSSSSSVKEAATHTPRFGFHLVSSSNDRPWEALSTPRTSLSLSAQVGIAVARSEDQIAHRSTFNRLQRLFSGKSFPSAYTA